jgi:hypothetical protein
MTNDQPVGYSDAFVTSLADITPNKFYSEQRSYLSGNRRRS